MEDDNLNDLLLDRHQHSPDIPLAAAAAATPVSKRIIVIAISLLVIYLIVSVTIFISWRDQFSPSKTHRFVDALYFSIVTMCTVGYGDIVPTTSLTKFFTTVLVIFAVVCLDFLLNRFLSHVLDLQEKAILERINTVSSTNIAITDHIFVDVNGKIKTHWKLGLAFCFVFLCVGAGALFLYFYEEMSLVDSLYLSVISVTTVGYGDKAFKKTIGRLFAAFWLPVSSFAMAILFYYFAEKKIETSVMNLPTITLSESESVISVWEYIVRKLKETGKISEDEVKLITSEYENRDRDDSLEITSPQVEAAGS